MRQYLYPSVPAAYAEVVDALRGCDLVVTPSHHVRRPDRRGEASAAMGLHHHRAAVPAVAIRSAGLRSASGCRETAEPRASLQRLSPEVGASRSPALDEAHDSVPRLGRSTGWARSTFRRTALPAVHTGNVLASDGRTAAGLAEANGGDRLPPSTIRPNTVRSSIPSWSAFWRAGRRR